MLFAILVKGAEQRIERSEQRAEWDVEAPGHQHGIRQVGTPLAALEMGQRRLRPSDARSHVDLAQPEFQPPRPDSISKRDDEFVAELVVNHLCAPTRCSVCSEVKQTRRWPGSSLFEDTRPRGGLMKDRLVTVEEAAVICGVSDETIRRRLARGRVPGAYRRGRGGRAPWAIPLSSLQFAGLRPIVGDDVLPERSGEGPAEVARLKAALRAKDDVIAALELAVEALREALRAGRDRRNGESAPPP